MSQICQGPPRASFLFLTFFSIPVIRRRRKNLKLSEEVEVVERRDLQVSIERTKKEKKLEKRLEFGKINFEISLRRDNTSCRFELGWLVVVGDPLVPFGIEHG